MLATKSLLKLHIFPLRFIHLLLDQVRQAASKRQPLHENELFTH